MGIIIADQLADASLEINYSSCEQAESIRVDDIKRFVAGRNTITFFRIEGLENELQVTATMGITNTFVDPPGTCFFIGRENRELDTNSPSSAIEFPQDVSRCSRSYSFNLSPRPNYRCIGFLTFNELNVSISMR